MRGVERQRESGRERGCRRQRRKRGELAGTFVREKFSHIEEGQSRADYRVSRELETAKVRLLNLIEADH